jgi:hypothetical protein
VKESYYCLSWAGVNASPRILDPCSAAAAAAAAAAIVHHIHDPATKLHSEPGTPQELSLKKIASTLDNTSQLYPRHTDKPRLPLGSDSFFYFPLSSLQLDLGARLTSILDYTGLILSSIELLSFLLPPSLRLQRNIALNLWSAS